MRNDLVINDLVDDCVNDPIEEVIEDVRFGKPVIISDDKDRENEGDLMVAAEKVTAQTIAFMMQHGKGLACVTLSEERLSRLGLPLQVAENKTPFGTNFAVSFDHISVANCGVTASGRATTILASVDDNAKAGDFVRPGFVYPLKTVAGGVLRRRGQTEASADLSALAGLKPAGVICEVMASDGHMIRDDELIAYCRTHNLKMTSVEDIIRYRLAHERTLRRVAECDVGDAMFVSSRLGSCIANEIAHAKTRNSNMRVLVYLDDATDEEHLAFVKGSPKSGAIVRIHSECLTGDVFGSQRCDCGHQLLESFRLIFEAGEGVVIYLHQEGRGIGLANKFRAYALQDRGFDTVDANIELGYAADLREYRAASQILKDLELSKVRLITNNPSKILALKESGINVLERVVIPTEWNDSNRIYLETKRERFGHIL